MSDLERPLTVEQAARIVYNTASPTREQVARIRDKIESGGIRRSLRGGLTTTRSALADYLAGRTSTSAGAARAAPRAANEPLPGFYRELLKEYFLAVLLRRKLERRSKLFAASVLAMQVAILLLPLGVFAWVYRGSLAAGWKSPERQAVERWLSEHYDEFEIHSLTNSAPSAARVKFWYSAKGSKRIESDRIFTISGDRVVSVDMAR